MCDTQQRLIIRWQINKNIFFQITFFLWASMQETKALSPSFFFFDRLTLYGCWKWYLLSKMRSLHSNMPKLPKTFSYIILNPTVCSCHSFSLCRVSWTIELPCSEFIAFWFRCFYESTLSRYVGTYIKNFSYFIQHLRKAWATRRVALERRATSCCLWCWSGCENTLS